MYSAEHECCTHLPSSGTALQYYMIRIATSGAYCIMQYCGQYCDDPNLVAYSRWSDQRWQGYPLHV